MPRKRLLEAYTQPVELHYGTGDNQAIIHLDPSVVGFELDPESMLAAADLERTRQPFWIAFWNYLWGRSGVRTNIPLRATYSEARLRQYLADEIAVRYDRPPEPAKPIVGTVSFQPGSPGIALDIDYSLPLIDAALRSTSQRVVDLSLGNTRPSRPSFQNLKVLLEQTIALSEYDGLIGLSLIDLQNGQEINLASNLGEPVPMPPDVAFSASSTIKIPIMISVFRRLGENIDEETRQNLNDMIAKSINPASDWLMEKVVDPVKGPLMVTEDAAALGLENTFLAGYFFPGAPLLQRFLTPANQRQDVTAEPDPYSQSTPSEIAALLQDIYQCAEDGGGALTMRRPWYVATIGSRSITR